MPDINTSIFEEAQRNQLVTEVDIQTQIALDDYQVQLSDIANPTQSQDNVVIDRFGEFLPHWNESLDFDTWVKMSMEVAGKRLLILRGNSSISNVSNGNDVFTVFDDFSTDQLGTYWLEDYTEFSVSGGELHSGASSSLYHQINLISSANWRIYGKVKNNDYTGDGWIGVNDASTRLRITGNGVGIRNSARSGGILWDWMKIVSGSETGLGSGGSGDLNYHIVEISKIGTTFKVYVDGVLVDTETVTEFNNTYFQIETYSSIDYDIVHMRKYTATEPTWLVNGVEQNIATALKSLGRAG